MFVAANDLPFEERYRAYVQVFGWESLERLLKTARRGDVDSLTEAFAVAASGDALNRLMRVDLMTQVPNDLLMLTDKMTMAASLECRVPLLNHELVELAARIPASFRLQGGKLKSLMKRALEGVLPPEILERKKRGFGAPIGAWLKRDLQPMMHRLLSRNAIELRGTVLLASSSRDHRVAYEPSRGSYRSSDGPANPGDLGPDLSGWTRCWRSRRRADRRDGGLAMRILYVCHRFPYPPARGGKISTFQYDQASEPKSRSDRRFAGAIAGGS